MTDHAKGLIEEGKVCSRQKNLLINQVGRVGGINMTLQSDVHRYTYNLRLSSYSKYSIKYRFIWMRYKQYLFREEEDVSSDCLPNT